MSADGGILIMATIGTSLAIFGAVTGSDVAWLGGLIIGTAAWTESRRQR